MSRRYLTKGEAETRLKKGKGVECFLGGFSEDGVDTIRWLSFSSSASGFYCELWESLDQGSVDYADVYSFEGLDGEYDAPREIFPNDSFKDLLSVLEERFHCVSAKLVNGGVVQNEYIEFIKNRAKST